MLCLVSRHRGVVIAGLWGVEGPWSFWGLSRTFRGFLCWYIWVFKYQLFGDLFFFRLGECLYANAWRTTCSIATCQDTLDCNLYYYLSSDFQILLKFYARILLSAVNSVWGVSNRCETKSFLFHSLQYLLVKTNRTRDISSDDVAHVNEFNIHMTI